jgi:hypothetical protein
MTHLIFKRVSVKFEVRREKRWRKKKVTAWHFQYHHERWHLTIRKSQTRYRKSVGASHLLAFVACASNFYFLIIFIFVKRFNYPLFKSIITKKNHNEMMKVPLVIGLILFTFKSYIVILLCN